MDTGMFICCMCILPCAVYLFKWVDQGVVDPFDYLAKISLVSDFSLFFGKMRLEFDTNWGGRGQTLFSYPVWNQVRIIKVYINYCNEKFLSLHALDVFLSMQ